MPLQDLLPLAFGLPGGPELWVIMFIVLILFGSKLPSVARNLGLSFKEFKKGIRTEVDEELDVLPGSDGSGKRIEGESKS